MATAGPLRVAVDASEPRISVLGVRQACLVTQRIPSPSLRFAHSIGSPARFYVSIVMKMILSHLLINYNFKLADPKARPYLTFGKVRLPNPFQTLLVREQRRESLGRVSS